MSNSITATNKPSSRIPTPSAWESSSLVWRFKQDSLQCYQDLNRKYGDIVYLYLLHKIVVLYHPDDVHHILKENHTNYKKSINYQVIKPVLGKGLVTSEGELWRRQRQSVGKMFTTSSIQSYIPQITNAVSKVLEDWNAQEHRFEMDLTTLFHQLTLKIASEVFFGANVSRYGQELAKAVHTASEIEIKRVYSLLRLPRWLPTTTNRQEKEAVKVIDKIVYGLIDQQKEQTSKRPNVLSRLTEIGMPRQQLRDEVTTLLLAGHETTSNALSWTIYLLSQNPKIYAKLKDELHAHLGKSLPTCADLDKLVYLQYVLLESMRLLPPVPVFSRENIQDDTLGGYSVSKGHIIMAIPWVTHRHPEFWIDALQFKPERFEKDPRPKAYFPFALGPRKCIGADFAMYEMKLILAGLLQKFDIQVTPNFNPGRKVGLTLSPSNGLKVQITKASR